MMINTDPNHRHDDAEDGPREGCCQIPVGTIVRLAGHIPAIDLMPALRADTYIVTSGGRAARPGVTHVRPNDGRRVAFRVPAASVEVVR